MRVVWVGVGVGGGRVRVGVGLESGSASGVRVRVRVGVRVRVRVRVRVWHCVPAGGSARAPKTCGGGGRGSSEVRARSLACGEQVSQ